MIKKPTPVKNNLSAEPSSENQPDKIAELTADLQRTRADFENYRKQVELQKQQAVTAAKQVTVAQVLPLLDQLQLAIKTYPEQLSALDKSFAKTLADFQLQLIDSAEGAEFNPELHEAVMMEDGEGDKELISETLRPGYYYNGEVLRPAMVKVKKS